MLKGPVAFPPTFAVGRSPAPLATFLQAPLRSRTVGFPESGSDLGCPPNAFPTRARLKRWHAYPPTRRGLRWASSLLRGPDSPGSVSRIRPATAKRPEPLYPVRVLPPPGWPPRATSKGVTPSSSLIQAHAPDQIPPAAFVPSLAGLCRLLPAPAGRWPFPTLSLRTFPWVPGPVPRQPERCTCPFLPVRHRPSPPPDYGSATARLRSKQLHADAGFEHVVIRNLPAPKFARHPGCPHQLGHSSRGGGGFYVWAEHGSLPSPAPDMLTGRTGQLPV